MARVFITGSADGLGRLAARTLLDAGHEIVVHARDEDRLAAVRDLVDRGAAAVVGDLADLDQTRSIAGPVNELGRMDAVIHNAGVNRGARVLPVNTEQRHQRRIEPHPAVHDRSFQDELLAALTRLTGTRLD